MKNIPPPLLLYKFLLKNIVSLDLWKHSSIAFTCIIKSTYMKWRKNWYITIIIQPYSDISRTEFAMSYCTYFKADELMLIFKWLYVFHSPHKWKIINLIFILQYYLCGIVVLPSSVCWFYFMLLRYTLQILTRRAVVLAETFVAFLVICRIKADSHSAAQETFCS